MAHHRNFTKAAEELFVGQPALSAHIKDLEAELGAALFIRSSRKLTLTAAGEELYKRAAPFFQGEEEMIQAVRQASPNRQVRLVVGTLGTNMIYDLPGVIRAFTEKHEKITAQLQRMNIDALLRSLKNGSTDVGFCFNSSAVSDPMTDDLNAVKVRESQIIVAMAKAHPLAKYDILKPEQLKDCCFFIQDPREASIPYRILMDICRHAGIEPQISETFRFIEPMLTAVALGDAVTITSDLIPAQSKANLTCIPLDVDIPIELDLIWNKKNKNQAAPLFVQHILNIFNG